MITYADNAKLYGMLKVHGITIALTQDAYLDGTKDNPYYTAAAIDGQGREYRVRWDVVEDWQDIEDAGDHCDWTDFEVRSDYGKLINFF